MRFQRVLVAMVAAWPVQGWVAGPGVAHAREPRRQPSVAPVVTRPCRAMVSGRGAPLAASTTCARLRGAEASSARGRFAEAAKGYERVAEGPLTTATEVEALARAVVLREALGEPGRAARLRQRLVSPRSTGSQERRRAARSPASPAGRRPGNPDRGGDGGGGGGGGRLSKARIARAAWEVVRATLPEVSPARAEADLRWYLRVFGGAGEPAHRLEALVRLAWLRWAASCSGAAGRGRCLLLDEARSWALEGGRDGAERPVGASGRTLARQSGTVWEVRRLLAAARRLWKRPVKAGPGRGGRSPGPGSSWAIAARLLEAELALEPVLSLSIPGALGRRLRRARPSSGAWRVLEGHIRHKVRRVQSLERRYLGIATRTQVGARLVSRPGRRVTVAALARIGQLRHHLWDWLATDLPRPPLPEEVREAYDGLVGDPFPGLRQRALAAYAICLRLARARWQGDAWQRFCETGRHALAPERYPAVRDRGPVPGRAPIAWQRWEYVTAP